MSRGNRRNAIFKDNLHRCQALLKKYCNNTTKAGGISIDMPPALYVIAISDF